MSASNQQRPMILIIGAGLSGLALAQVVKAHGIPFRIFERDDGVQPRNQGWAVSLDECLDDLQDLLPKDLGDIYTTTPNHATGLSDSGAVINAMTGAIIARKGGVPKGQPGHFLKANRSKLRKYLMQGIEVELNHSFSHYVEDSTGVTAYFHNGLHARGSILIGADGASSRVRTQLLKGARAIVAPYVPIVGVCTITDQDKIRTFLEITKTAFIAAGENIRVVVGLLAYESDGTSVTFHYAVSHRPEDADAQSEWTMKATSQQLYDKALALIQGMPTHLREIIECAGPDSIATPQIRFLEFVPPDTLPRGRVVLMGDAGHTMMPFRGAGANTALRDVCDFGQLLQDPDSKKDILRMLERYSRRVCQRGREMVLASREASRVPTKMLGVDRYSNPQHGKHAATPGSWQTWFGNLLARLQIWRVLY